MARFQIQTAPSAMMSTSSARPGLVATMDDRLGLHMLVDPLDAFGPTELLRRLRHLPVDLPADGDLRGVHIQPELHGHSRLDGSTLLANLFFASDSLHNADRLAHFAPPVGFMSSTCWQGFFGTPRGEVRGGAGGPR